MSSARVAIAPRAAESQAMRTLTVLRTPATTVGAVLVVLSVLSATPTAVRANGAPQLMEQPGVELVITGKAADGHSQLVLPRSVGLVSEAATTGRSMQSPGPVERITRRQASTVIAGIALSLAVIVLGLWLARRRPPRRPVTISLVVAALALGVGGGTTLANMAPTWDTIERNEPLVTIDRVVVSEGATRIELQLTPRQYAALGKHRGLDWTSHYFPPPEDAAPVAPASEQPPASESE